ncbi:MAG TPA: MBOAT family protein, partial [Fimbriimonas sp.]|nr:MBOAT family protein [Fimbriimonas sp.]
TFTVIMCLVLIVATTTAAMLLPKPIRAPWIPIACAALFLLLRDVPGVVRLVASTFFLLTIMKAWSVLERPKHKVSSLDWFYFWTIWPGFDLESFERREQAHASTAKYFSSGLCWAVTGVCTFVATAYFWDLIPIGVRSWIAIFSLLSIIHFGISGILLTLLRMQGRPVKPLFMFPFQSKTLMEFWTRRWNMAFVEMGRRLFQPRLNRIVGRKNAVFGIFIISAGLHELAISYPSRGGYGLPSLYFLLTLVGILVERKLRIRSRLWTAIWILLPLPLLFHIPFHQTFISPMMVAVHDLLHKWTLETYLGILLWVLPLAQLLVLAASIQVPIKLNWKSELQLLNPFNRKLMWVYGGFIVSCILGFSIITAVLHNEFLEGGKTQAVLAAFMCLFWVQRLLVDRFYFSDEDWPSELNMRVGHSLLNALFLFLAISYGLTCAWSLWR